MLVIWMWEFLCISQLQSMIFFSFCACDSCYPFKLCFLHVIDLVYNGLEFILICSRHCLWYPPNVSSKIGVEFILVVLYISGLSSFCISHHTQTYQPWSKYYLALARIFYENCYVFLVFVTPYPDTSWYYFQPPIIDIPSARI